MKKTIYTLLFATSMMPAIALASDDEALSTPVKIKLNNYKNELQDTPTHVAGVIAPQTYTPVTQRVLEALEAGKYRRHKHEITAVKRLQLVDEELAEKKVAALASAEENHRHELEQLHEEKIAITRTEQLLNEELAQLRATNQRLEEEYASLQIKKSRIEEQVEQLKSQNTQIENKRLDNIKILLNELSEVEKELDTAVQGKVNAQIQVKRIEQEKTIMAEKLRQKDEYISALKSKGVSPSVSSYGVAEATSNTATSTSTVVPSINTSAPVSPAANTVIAPTVVQTPDEAEEEEDLHVDLGADD